MGSSNKREASSPHGRQSSRSSDPNLASQEEGEIPSCPQRTRRSPSGNRVFVLLVRPTAPCPEALLSAMWGRAPLDTVVSVQICHPRPRWRGRHRGENHVRPKVSWASIRGIVLVALAIAGDALLPRLDTHRGVPPSERVRQSLDSVFSIARHHDLVVTHGHVCLLYTSDAADE